MYCLQLDHWRDGGAREGGGGVTREESSIMWICGFDYNQLLNVVYYQDNGTGLYVSCVCFSPGEKKTKNKAVFER